MRRRLLLVLLTFSIVAVAAFALPLLGVTAAQRTQQLALSRSGALDRFAALADQASGTGDVAQLVSEATRYTELYGEPLVVVDADRGPIVETGGLRAADVAEPIDQALRNEPSGQLAPLRPWSGEDVLRHRPVGSGTRVTGAVVMRVSVRAAAADISRQWALIALGAVSALAACGVLALVVARWILRPIGELESGVRAVAAGSRQTRVAVGAGPPELRALAGLFNGMSEAVAEAEERQRRMVADASHQLRNPMAALRLRVDALERRIQPEAMAGYWSTVEEVERLEALLDRLLVLSTPDDCAADRDGGADDSTCDPHAVVADRVAAWRSAADAAGVVLRTGDPPASSVDARCARDDLAQILDVVLDNAVKYAGAGAEVTVSETVDRHWYRLAVTDTGPGLAPDELAMATGRFWRADRDRGSRGTGLGLSIADRLATARGGYLHVSGVEPHGLSVRVELPVARDGGARP
ncbi:HAMP domain-containing sensor histidine kinase [Saccharopolyspora spinosporotrichia]|uniref:histidine kinase n=1 Tax=Saccharopolyspora erythraea TaxID=1836 RepID=A0ABN1D7H8_SACER